MPRAQILALHLENPRRANDLFTNRPFQARQMLLRRNSRRNKPAPGKGDRIGYVRPRRGAPARIARMADIRGGQDDETGTRKPLPRIRASGGQGRRHANDIRTIDFADVERRGQIFGSRALVAWHDQNRKKAPPLNEGHGRERGKMFSRAGALVQKHHENAFRVRAVETLKFSRRLQRSGAPPDLPAARQSKRAGLRVPLRSWNEAAQNIDRLDAKSKLQRRRIAQGQKFIGRAKPRGESRQRSLLPHAQRTGCTDGS